MTKVLIWAISVLIISAIIATAVWKNPLTPSIKSGSLETAKVDIGTVLKTVPAHGVVEPENEVLILSPASSIILSIPPGVGSKVNKGDVILKLNDKEIRNQIDDIEDQLEVKNNSLDKTLLSANSVRVDLDYNVEVKKLRITSLKSELADQEQLLEVGGVSPARIEKTKQEIALAEKDLETLQVKNAIRLKQLVADEKGLRLQIEMQQKQLDQKQELLHKMIIRAPSSGIILEINGKEGEKVNTDRLLVRMSDLSTFKLRATIEEQHDNVAKTGRNVFAMVDGKKLKGKIGTISPTIKDGKIEFDVFLDQSDYYKLRPNMAIDLLVTENRKDSVLRIKRGPVFDKKNIQSIYSKEADKAKLRKLKTGLEGNEYVEIIDGASSGDELIISDNSSMRKLEEVEIK